MSKSVLIIGAGLGGLLCGQLLVRKGLSVTVLEADTEPGGILHGFTWEGARCDRGFHSVGGLAPGEPLEKIFRPLGLMDLPWYKADPDEGLGFLRLNTRSDFELSHILGPFRQSTWRLEGGGDTLSQALANGLDIHYQKPPCLYAPPEHAGERTGHLLRSLPDGTGLRALAKRRYFPG